MDHAARVGIGQRVGHVLEDADDVADGELAFVRQAVGERFPLDERHHVVEKAPGLAGVVERQDVGVLELGDELDLTRKAIVAEGVGELRPEHLERHLAVVLEVAREVDRGHPASPDLPNNHVLVAEGGGEAGLLVGQKDPVVGGVTGSGWQEP